ncbi:MAG: hypothetical protein HND44_21015 [Chloroflexi bacterium]|nr:hypothetical protein [Ardenticatenaceae bacterium]MBL1130927.1 hypothetical protein [Chloroflexota bacterium]NOG37023.1 hypothetical protein [Chloroflexota bacterium]
MDTYYWLYYPADFKAQLKALLHQQMWLFGRDILCPEGNLLYHYRLNHQHAEAKGCSMYTRHEADRQIVLWGWGIWLGQENVGGIFMGRYKARAQFTAVPTLTGPIHRPESLPAVRQRLASETAVGAMRDLLAQLLTWLADYEAWVLAAYGRAWRQTALKPFPHAHTRLDEVEQICDQWRILAEQSHHLPIKTNKRNRP